MQNADENDTAELGANREDDDFIHRLRQAVQNGGGLTKVSQATGIPTRRLSYYLQGREIRRSALISIAKVAAVSVEWLATGEAEMRSAAGTALNEVVRLSREAVKNLNAPIAPGLPDQPAEPHQVPLAAPTGHDIDVVALAKAMQIVEMLTETARQKLAALEKAIRVKNAYLLLTEPEENLPALPHHVPRGS